jgi:hypothetical protein
VDINLVPHVPENLVVRRIKEAVEDEGELHDPQVGGKMTASANSLDNVNEEFPHLGGQLFQLFERQVAEVAGRVYPVEQTGQT